eukprot:GFUD01013764.1.p1 GENE.GFUD01013764.1~~GFUD01013764.1.p1  ORF type:complete len:2085 (+),score=698.75 GFUD01013764.1:68-6256(+)
MVREKPPPTPNSGEKKKRARSKSVKRGPTLSPFQERLKDSEFYTKPKFDEFLSIPAVKDRLLLINGLLSDDVTDITRAWPLQLKNKDSRLRRELSDLGKECFVTGQHGDVLHYYNQALMYSSGKGVAHTLARRAAFLLSTGEHKLAVRDLSVALEYGGLESELLDFLLTHHTEDEEKTRANNEASIDNAINAMKNAKLDMQNATTSDISKWADEIRDNLSKAAKLRKNDPANRKIKADILKNIINSIEQASKETNLDENIEIEELEVPKLLEKNPLCPAFSEAAAITFDPEKGRIVKARRAIKAGEMICVDDPTCAMLCPENKDNINNHCLNCFRFTKAPLPCDTCCSVVFCSKKCKDQANQTYHKFECQLKLYELFQFEGRDVFSLFLALRAVTQKPLHYFTENQKEIEKFLDLDEPTFPFPGRAYQSTDYRALCNLMTHVSDIDGDVALKNAVLSVFFLRFIKKSGYFGNTGKLRGDKSLASIETFILRLIHQVICAQTYNSHSVHKITKAFEWERIGTAINPSLALVNHSCDSNSLRCNVNKSSILVAARHIPEGEEITDTYSGHFRDTIKHQREYHTLKHYMFECECAACKENWPLEEDIPYELFRIPTFEQEKIYKVRHGDKKDLVKEVIELRRAVEKSMTYKRFSEALINYQNLCEKLEEHLRRPHIYFLQARSGISHCIWNLYCTQFPELPIEEEDEEDVNALRDAANLIYKNNMSEKLVANNGLELGPCEVESTTEVVADDAEKASLLESTRKLLEQSSLKVQGALAETQEQRHRFEQERIKALTTCNGSSSTSDPEKNDSSELPEQNVLKTQDIINNKQTIEEREELIKKRQFDQEIIEKEKLLRLEKRKQWDLEDEQRLAREKERKLKREQESKETIKREKEKEELKRKKKRVQEEERIKQKQQEYEKKMEEERGKRQKQEEQRLKRKREEEEELQQLLLEIGDDFDVITTLEEAPSTQNSMENKSESKLNAIEIEQLKVENTPSQNGFSDDIHGNKKSTAGGVKPNTNGVKSEISEVQVFSPDISFKNMIDFSNENDKLIQSNLSPEENTKPDCEPANVWTSLRKIREGNTDYTTIFSSKTDADAEVVSITDIDDMIKGLAQQIADKRTTKKIGQDGTNEKLSMIQENEESDEEIVLEKDNSIIHNTDPKKDLKPFDYEIWKSEMEDIYQQPEYPFEKKAEDELYLQNLRQKIQVNVKKVNKENKVKDKEKDRKVEKDNKATPAKKVDDFAMLKLKDKERKKKKQDVKFQQKVLDNEDKLKEMSIKTKKIEKIALDSHVEIQKIREMARKLVAKSEAKENEFNEIFLNLDNLDKISIESEKKNGKKGRKKTENIQSSILTKELHWTEEENNKWTSDKKGISKVTNVLAALRAAAENGQSKLVTDSLKETIYNCKKMEEESQEEKKREKTRQIEEEKERKEEEIKKQKNKENEEKKTMQIEKLKKQKEDEQRILKAVESTEKLKKESKLKKLAEEEKLAEEKILAEERIKMEAIEKNKRIEKEKEKRAREKEAELKKQAEVATYKNKNPEKILIEESKKLGASEKKQKLDTEKEDEINRQKRSKDLQSKWQEKEKQRVEKEEQTKKLKEEERLKRQEEYIEKMKKEEERKRKETHARLEEEMKMVEEEKARELQLLETRIKREEECRKKEMERKLMAEKKLQAEIEKRKQEEGKKLQAERERKEKEYRAIQEERECIEKIWEEKKRKCIEIENESQQNDSNENKSHAFLKQSNGKVGEKFELNNSINDSNNKSPEQAETARREVRTGKINFAEEKKLAQERMKMEAIDKMQRIEKEKEKRARAKEAELNKKAEDAAYNKQNEEKILMEESKKVEAEEKKQKLESEMKSEEDKLKRLAVTMKQMDQETIKQQIDNKPPPHTQAKHTVPKPVSEKVPDIKEIPVIKSSHAKDVTDRPSNVVTVSSNSFMPQKNRKSEVQILKIGSPSQIRKAVLCDVKLDEPLEKLNGNENNYQITKIPTTIFEFKKPKPKSEPPKNYSITKVPTEKIELGKKSQNYVENVVKYSETIPARKRSASVPRPPPPAFKPPPPPPIF